MSAPPVAVTAVDPFDLPEWLGEGEVVWRPDRGVRIGSLVTGTLTGTAPEHRLACDVLAVDEAYPAVVADEAVRAATHQAWRHGQVHLVTRDGRLTLTVPGRDLDADRVLDVLARFARAVGAPEGNYAALLRLGR